MEKGFFGNMFDFNGDGELDMFEQSIDYMVFQELIENDEETEEDEWG